MPLSRVPAGIATTEVSFKNRIINGDMRIDQRNAGASTTPSSTSYTLDRWRLGNSAGSRVSVQQSTDAPVGFSYSALITTVSQYSIAFNEEINFGQRIEGFNAADLNYGTSNAKTVTLSFWVKSSLTGLFGGALSNSDGNRRYVFSYSISSANTWEYKTITITGDTTGTWVGATNGIGLIIQFSIAAGSDLLQTAGVWYGVVESGVTGQNQLIATNGATWRVTGVQLEVGSTSTSFDYRPYGNELALCQRYYTEIVVPDNVGQNGGGISSGYQVYTSMFFPFKQTMRAAPSIIQNLSLTTDVTGTVTYVTSVDGYVLKHGNTTALYSYINGIAKFSSEL